MLHIMLVYLYATLSLLVAYFPKICVGFYLQLVEEEIAKTMKDFTK